MALNCYVLHMEKVPELMSRVLFDAGRLRKNIKDLEEMLGTRAELCFPMKANPWLAKEVAYRDVMKRKPSNLVICPEQHFDLLCGIENLCFNMMISIKYL